MFISIFFWGLLGNLQGNVSFLSSFSLILPNFRLSEVAHRAKRLHFRSSLKCTGTSDFFFFIEIYLTLSKCHYGIVQIQDV